MIGVVEWKLIIPILIIQSSEMIASNNLTYYKSYDSVSKPI